MNRIATLTLAAVLSLAATTAHAQRPAAKAAPEESQAALARAAKIPEATARRTALSRVSGARVDAEELEREGGRLLYSYDLKVPGKSGIEEVQVDAITGRVISQTHESPAAEKAEAKAEKAETKAAKAQTKATRKASEAATKR
jgi:uncharacterized membrane protein YkoI